MAEQTPTEGQQQFGIQKIYLKDVSFEAPNAPESFTMEWKPEMNVELNWTTSPVAENMHEVVLSVTVTSKIEDKTVFLVEIHQAGLFGAQGFSEEELAPLLGAYCPNLLFPYAREAVSDLVAKGGFPQLLLAPVNFDALYAQRMQGVQAQVQGDGSAQH